MRENGILGVSSSGLPVLPARVPYCLPEILPWQRNRDPTGSKRLKRTEIPTRPFGATGVNVSCLSLGGMFDIPSNQLLLKQALKWGVTYWDTADCYEGGNSEIGIGEFLKKYPETRQKIFLVTKSDRRDPRGTLGVARPGPGADQYRSHRFLLYSWNEQHRRDRQRNQGLGGEG